MWKMIETRINVDSPDLETYIEQIRTAAKNTGGIVYVSPPMPLRLIFPPGKYDILTNSLPLIKDIIPIDIPEPNKFELETFYKRYPEGPHSQDDNIDRLTGEPL